jgi:hypothetical protein
MNFFRVSPLVIFAFFAGRLLAQQPVNAPAYPLDDLRPGQHGQVWTVFRGTEPEPFDVEVTGVVRNALGPGKSLILCQLTDPRVQNMGAVAGMSGSPLYIDGKLAGALSYQIQRFETVRYAGFTPAADLAEVRDKPDLAPSSLPTVPVDSKRGSDSLSSGSQRSTLSSQPSSYYPLRPVFTLSGLSPAVADLFAPRFSALGLEVTSLGGSTQASALNSQPSSLNAPSALRAGSAVSVALATGDITLAGTGTVSRVDGTRITAFGHPMLALGDVELPMCAADIVAILPSNLQSFKIANTGNIIGTITQDRLSAVSGTLGAGPAMIAVEVSVAPSSPVARTLRFQVARQAQLTPSLIATGVTQAIMGSNDSALAHGFRLTSNIHFSSTQNLSAQTLHAGPQAFAQGLNQFVQGLSQDLQNPYEKTFPSSISFTIEPLPANPAVTIDLFQLSRASVRAGDTITATLAWRDYQGEAHRDIITIPIDAGWAGKKLDVILAPGSALDELTGRPSVIAAATLRSFDSYLAAMRDDRLRDGIYLAVVEKSTLFTDETASTPEVPGSIERIARAADEARFQKRDAVIPLFERHLLAGKLATLVVRRPLRVTD